MEEEEQEKLQIKKVKRVFKKKLSNVVWKILEEQKAIQIERKKVN